MSSALALTETRTYLFTFTPPPPAPWKSSSILNYIIFFQKPKCFQNKRKHKDRFIFLYLILGARGKILPRNAAIRIRKREWVIILVPAAATGQGWNVGREHAYHLILGLPVRWVARFSYYKWRPPREKESQCKQDLNSGAGALKRRVRSPLGRPAYLIFTGRHSSAPSAS